MLMNMKKFIIMFAMSVFCTLGIFAQNNYYNGGSKFTDNISVTLQGGILTTAHNALAGHTAVAPIIVLGADKYITPALGIGVEARTLVGTGTVNESRFNSHTAFDAVNISAYGKLNLTNLIMYDGTRHFFEPVVYAGLGWGHNTCCESPTLSGVYADNWASENAGSMLCNRLTARAGCEFNFNLDKTRAWGVVVNPSFVWGNIDNMRLDSHNGQFELTAGVVYHFKTSNGTHHFVTYTPEPIVREIIKEAPVKARPEHRPEPPKPVINNSYRVSFDQNSAQLSIDAKAILDKIPAGSKVTVSASASPEGSSKRNAELINARATVVKEYLISRGVIVTEITDVTAARQAIVTINN